MRAAFWLMLVTSMSAAQGQSGGTPPPPPEIKKTVDAFVGHWTLAGTDQEPGTAKPEHFNVVMDCKRAALGAAVACTIAGKVPGVGAIEASTVIGYSPDEKRVRWMEISSTGEYHDHKGPWNGDAIEFEPLPFSVGGEQATEYLSIRFPSPGQQVVRSVTETAAGQSILEWSGRRK